MVNFGSSDSNNSSFVWSEQTPYLTQMYQGAQDLASNQDVQSYSQNEVQNYMPGLRNNINTINANTNTFDNISAGNNLGMKTMASHMDMQSNPYLDGQIKMAQSNLLDNMKNVGLAGNRSSAGLSGNYGGSRHAIQDYLLKKDTLGQMTNLETQMRGQAYDNAANRSLDAAGNYVTNTANAAGASSQNAAGAIDATGNVHNLGMNQFTDAWMPLQMQAQITGGPTVLGEGSSSGFNMGFTPPK